MQKFELTVIIATKTGTAQVIDWLTAMAQEAGFYVGEVKDEGVKPFSYPIEGRDQGRFLTMQLVTDSRKAATKYSRMIAKYNDVMRYLLCKVNKKEA